MAQKYGKSYTFYWEKVLFEFEASNIFICFKMNISGCSTLKDYLLVEKSN